MTSPSSLGGDLFVSFKVTRVDYPPIRRLLLTVENLLYHRRKILQVCSDKGIPAFTLSPSVGYFEESWEISFCLTLADVDSERLEAAARHLADEFYQDSVIVRDFNRGRVKLVRGTAQARVQP